MESNREDAARSLEIAKRALAEGDVSKAVKFAEKANRLFPSSEAAQLIKMAQSGGGGGGGSAGPRPAAAAAAAKPAASASRASNGSASSAEAAPGPAATPEQKELTRDIMRTKDYYDILKVAKSATDDDIKKAYRKMALKLHPDKNKAPQAEEAFKKVSKAFDCLSDADKRASYDRYGTDDPQQGGVRFRRPGGGGGGMHHEDIDPFEVFNMFFGGMGGPMGGMGGMGPGVRFQTRTGPGFHYQQPRRGPQYQQQQHPGEAGLNWRNLMQLLPLIVLFIFTFWPQGQEAVYSLRRVDPFTSERITTTNHIKYFVREGQHFDDNFRPKSEKRFRLEQRIEYEYRDHLEMNCAGERKKQQKVYQRNKEEARKMRLPHCEELKGWSTANPYSYIYGG